MSALQEFIESCRLAADVYATCVATATEDRKSMADAERACDEEIHRLKIADYKAATQALLAKQDKAVEDELHRLECSRQREADYVARQDQLRQHEADYVTRLDQLRQREAYYAALLDQLRQRETDHAALLDQLRQRETDHAALLDQLRQRETDYAARLDQLCKREECMCGLIAVFRARSKDLAETLVGTWDFIPPSPAKEQANELLAIA